jgi:hypothetical protein
LAKPNKNNNGGNEKNSGTRRLEERKWLERSEAWKCSRESDGRLLKVWRNCKQEEENEQGDDDAGKKTIPEEEEDPQWLEELDLSEVERKSLMELEQRFFSKIYCANPHSIQQPATESQPSQEGRLQPSGMARSKTSPKEAGQSKPHTPQAPTSQIKTSRRSSQVEATTRNPAPCLAQLPSRQTIQPCQDDTKTLPKSLPLLVPKIISSRTSSPCCAQDQTPARTHGPYSQPDTRQENLEKTKKPRKVTKIWMMFPDEQKHVKLQEVTDIGLQVTTRRPSLDKNKKKKKIITQEENQEEKQATEGVHVKFRRIDETKMTSPAKRVNIVATSQDARRIFSPKLNKISKSYKFARSQIY